MIDVSGYAISGVLIQPASYPDLIAPKPHSTKSKFLSKSNFKQGHPVAYFFRKIISTKTCYKTHNNKLLVIVEGFKIWRQYLEGYKYKPLVLTNPNNLYWFIDIKSLHFYQVQ